MNNKPRKHTIKKIVLFCLTALTLMAAWVALGGESAGPLETSKSSRNTPQPGAAKLWTDPETVLEGTLELKNMPVSDIARMLSQSLSNKLDVLVPDKGPEKYSISLRLRNATAGELFNAMNRIFEAGMTPLRWELTMNGNRPTAVLRVLERTTAEEAAGVQGQQAIGRSVIYVGDLLGNEKSGGMAMTRIFGTLMETYMIAYGKEKGDLLQFHEKAELIIVRGTADEIRFIKDTVEALKQKVQKDQKAHLY